MTLDYGLKVSKTGENVLTAANKDLVFSSSFKTFKIFSSGLAAAGNRTIAHNLGWAPAFKAFVKLGSAYYPDPPNYHPTFSQLGEIKVQTNSSDLEVTNSTIYDVAYYIYADLAETYSGSSPVGTKDYGMKVSEAGVDVLSAKEYELQYSSRYRALKFEPTLVGSTTLYLPAINCTASPNIQTVSTSIAHGLGYPPFYLLFMKTNVAAHAPGGDTNARLSVPRWLLSGDTDALIYSVSSYCNSTNIVITFEREAECFYYFDPCDIFCTNWPAETITLYYYIFREDLSIL